MDSRYAANSGYKIPEVASGNWLARGSQAGNEVAQCVRAARDAGISTSNTACVCANTAASREG